MYFHNVYDAGNGRQRVEQIGSFTRKGADAIATWCVLKRLYVLRVRRKPAPVEAVQLQFDQQMEIARGVMEWRPEASPQMPDEPKGRRRNDRVKSKPVWRRNRDKRRV